MVASWFNNFRPIVIAWEQDEYQYGQIQSGLFRMEPTRKVWVETKPMTSRKNCYVFIS